MLLNPSDPAAYVGRGNVYMDKGQYDLAISDFTTAIEKNPADAQAYFGRGLAHEKKGETGLANKDYEKARELSQGR